MKIISGKRKAAVTPLFIVGKIVTFLCRFVYTTMRRRLHVQHKLF